MVNSKRKWVCSACAAEFIVWEGKCRACKAIATLEEVTLSARIVSTETQAQKRLRRRAKDSERGIAKRMTAIDGADPNFSRIASSTGRTGHISGMRVDAVSRTYVIENKNRKMPTWLITAWVLINQKGDDFQKNVLLHVDPPNMPREYPTQGIKKRLDTMAIITQGRHEDLIQKERVLSEAAFIFNSDITDKAKIQLVKDLLIGGKSDKAP